MTDFACAQLDITDDDFLSLMHDDGSTKDDVKVPSGEVGDKINKLFKEEEKDTSAYHRNHLSNVPVLTSFQTSSSSLPWARSAPLTPRRPPRAPVKFLPNRLDEGFLAAHAVGIQSIPSAGAISGMLRQHGLRPSCGHAGL